IPRHHVVANDDIFADVASVANLAVFPDPGGALDHRSMLNHRPATDENGIAHERLADELALNRWLQTEFQVGRYLRQRLPDIFQVVKNDPVLGATEIQVSLGLKHGEDL